jgi:ABC-type multidrug transport system fused ATPase/permease subunit
MHWDYGYMEEGQLGKPYNIRLLRRLSGYAKPYRRTIAVALVLTLLITLFDLALPYLSKIAIDRFILSSWYALDLSRARDQGLQKTLGRYTQVMERTSDGTWWVVSNRNWRQLDPEDRHALTSQGVLRSERLYRVPPSRSAGLLEKRPSWSYRSMPDGSLLVSHQLLQQLPKEELLRIRGDDVRGVTLVAVALVFFLTATLVISYGQYYLLEFTGQHVMQDIRLGLFEKMQHQAPRFFDRHPVGRLVTRVTNDVENLNEMFKSVIITVCKDVFLLVGILSVLLYLNWRLALLSFTLLPFIFALTYLFSSRAREVFRELRTTVAKINAFLQERLSGMRIIQLFAQEESQQEAFHRINHENFSAGIKQIRIFAVFMPTMELLSSLGVALIIWYGGGKVIQEELTLGSLVAFISYVQMFFRPIRDISEKYNIMQLAMASTERIFEFMDQEEVIPEPHHPKKPPESGYTDLEFQDVSFSYQEGKRVLHHVSFQVPAGKTVAIVGPTGAGKSTVVNLAERFYDPDEGSVRRNGVDLREWGLKDLRESSGLCLQDVFIFAGSASENIALGRCGVNQKAIEGAAAVSNALPFIRRLREAFAHEIGEGGATLSAGERQLLSFARALAADPPLLILDEATSSVDPETEGLIQDAVAKMAANRTTLIIAHRLATVRHADQILVMQQGQVVEQGTHEELLAFKGTYYRLRKLRDQ